MQNYFYVKQLASLIIGAMLLLQVSPITPQYFRPIYVVAEDAKCLAENIYFESRGEPVLGQVAVSFVVLNRARDSRFPRSICQVIKQRDSRMCQFSWVCTKNKAPDKELMRKAMNTSIKILAGRFQDPTNGALFFHATSIKPGWKLKRTISIGNHIFYKHHD